MKILREEFGNDILHKLLFTFIDVQPHNETDQDQQEKVKKQVDALWAFSIGGNSINLKSIDQLRDELKGIMK